MCLPATPRTEGRSYRLHKRPVIQPESNGLGPGPALRTSFGTSQVAGTSQRDGDQGRAVRQRRAGRCHRAGQPLREDAQDAMGSWIKVTWFHWAIPEGPYELGTPRAESKARGGSPRRGEGRDLQPSQLKNYLARETCYEPRSLTANPASGERVGPLIKLTQEFREGTRHHRRLKGPVRALLVQTACPSKRSSVCNYP